jgi:hypothetical protein
MKKIIVRLADVIDVRTVHGLIDSYIPESLKKMIPENKPNPFFKFSIKGLDPTKVLKSVNESMDIYGYHGFLPHHTNSKGIATDRSSYYGGFSISYNPTIAYPVPEHASAMGEPKVNLNNFFKSDAGRQVWLDLETKKLTPRFYEICFEEGLDSVKKFLLKENIISDPNLYNWDGDFESTKRIQKNGYFDTYGFRKLTQGANHGALGELLRTKFSRSIVRSRVAIIDARNWFPKMKDYMWHYDEPLYLNLRINIPLVTTPNYVCEVKDQGTYPLEPGYGYSWDTTIVHRVYAKSPENSVRTNLVIGSSPWFDYDEEQDAYVSNEFYGEMHPFDMLVNGHIIKDIEIKG